jgi:hypothetical protein
MRKLEFDINIEAPKQKVWDILWNDATYRQWTSVFAEGSHAVSDWKEGDRVLFLSGSGEGMYSRIEKKVPGEAMWFKHLGVLKDGKEQPMDEETKKWSGAMEKYNLNEKEGVTGLHVELDAAEEHQEYFSKAFPKALDNVKTLSER